MGGSKMIKLKTLLKENTKWLAFFKGNPKKDDLADSFLQGLWFLKAKKLIVVKNK